MIRDLWQDLGYGLRMMRKSPGFTAVALLSLALEHGMILVLTGALVGALASLALSRLTELLFGVSATNATTFIGAAAELTIVALLACYIPARRATKVDPLIALRYE
jgi:putative ABC transport system permease protein